MLVKHSLLLLSALCALGLLNSCSLWKNPTDWVKVKREFKIPAAEVKALEAKTHNGSIVVTGEKGLTHARVIARIEAGGQGIEDAQACLDALSLIVEAKDGVLHARYELERRSGWGIKVSFESVQPMQASVKAITHNGEVSVNRVHADVIATSHNGRIRATNGNGAWTFTTHNGSIKASGTSSRFAMKTHNNAIHVALANGGEIEGSVASHNGSINLELPSNVSAGLECKTHNGRITCDIPFRIVSSERRHLRGDLGEGQGKLKLVTHNGSIAIRNK